MGTRASRCEAGSQATPGPDNEGPILAAQQLADGVLSRSGIFGYVNYLVEKDRKVILQTLINGKPSPAPRRRPAATILPLTRSED